MGYDLHVTRADSWLDSAQHPIPLSEWEAYVRADPEMRMDGFCEATLDDGTVIRVEEPGIAVWTKHSKHGVGGGMAWICWGNGELTAKNPDDELRVKLHAIATALGARVQGDEGECYGPTGEMLDG